MEQLHFARCSENEEGERRGGWSESVGKCATWDETREAIRSVTEIIR